MGSPDTALYSMIAVAIWKEAGFKDLVLGVFTNHSTLFARGRVD